MNRENEHKTHGRNISSSFSLKLGWGDWKFTLFSWELEINKHPTQNNNRVKETKD
jgi:hypothetical protein